MKRFHSRQIPSTLWFIHHSFFRVILRFCFHFSSSYLGPLAHRHHPSPVSSLAPVPPSSSPHCAFIILSLSLSPASSSSSPIAPHPTPLSFPSPLSSCSSPFLLACIHLLVPILDGATRCSIAAVSPFLIRLTVPHARCIWGVAFFSLYCKAGMSLF